MIYERQAINVKMKKRNVERKDIKLKCSSLHIVNQYQKHTYCIVMAHREGLQTGLVT